MHTNDEVPPDYCFQCEQTGKRFTLDTEWEEVCDDCYPKWKENDDQNRAERAAERAFESYHGGGSGWNYEEAARQQWIQDQLKR